MGKYMIGNFADAADANIITSITSRTENFNNCVYSVDTPKSKHIKGHKISLTTWHYHAKSSLDPYVI